MKRIVEKQIENGRAILKKNERMDLCVSEMYYLRGKFLETAEKSTGQAILDLMVDSFWFGVAVGYRCRRKEEA